MAILVGISVVTTGGNPLQDATITCSSEDADHIANGEQTGPAKYLVDGDKRPVGRQRPEEMNG